MAATLMTIGSVRFQIAPFSLMDYQHSHRAEFAEKAVIGASPVMEWTGEGAETWTMRARLFPDRFGGLDALAALEAIRRAGSPQYMMRGDGKTMGWIVIETISERSTYLDAGGVGKVIEVDIGVRRVSAPSSVSYFSIMAKMLGLA